MKILNICTFDTATDKQQQHYPVSAPFQVEGEFGEIYRQSRDKLKQSSTINFIQRDTKFYYFIPCASQICLLTTDEQIGETLSNHIFPPLRNYFLTKKPGDINFLVKQLEELTSTFEQSLGCLEVAGSCGATATASLLLDEQSLKNVVERTNVFDAQCKLFHGANKLKATPAKKKCSCFAFLFNRRKAEAQHLLSQDKMAKHEKHGSITR